VCAARPSGKSVLAPFLFELKALEKAMGLPTRDKDVQEISDRQRLLLADFVAKVGCNGLAVGSRRFNAQALTLFTQL
jgi:hypothetical protein